MIFATIGINGTVTSPPIKSEKKNIKKIQIFLDINQIIFIVIFVISFVIVIITLYKADYGEKMNPRVPWLIIPAVITIFADIDKTVSVYVSIDIILMVFYVCVLNTKIWNKIHDFFHGEVL